MRVWSVAPRVLLLLVCCGGCGQETVTLASAGGADASLDSRPADAAVECSPGQPGACSSNGAPCTTQATCCSNRC